MTHQMNLNKIGADWSKVNMDVDVEERSSECEFPLFLGTSPGPGDNTLKMLALFL